MVSTAGVSGLRAQQPAGAPAVPPGYVIGPQDVLSVVFWRDKDMSADVVVVRPDGKISLPLLNEVHAAGLHAGAASGEAERGGTPSTSRIRTRRSC